MDDKTTAIAACTSDGDDFVTSEIGVVEYRVSGKQMMICVPQKMLDIDDFNKIYIEFKWADADDNVMFTTMEDFYLYGDVAPLGRLNWVYQNYIPPEQEVPDDTYIHKEHALGEFQTVEKAGFDKEGKQEAKCAACDYVEAKAIAAVAVPVIKDQTFNNKKKTPKVTVVDAEGNAVESKATFANKTRKSVGKYKVTVKLTGADYEGSKDIYFKINPAGKSISKLSKGKKSFTVKWKKASTTYRKQMTGYQIKYSTSSKMTKAKTVTVKSTKATSKTIKKLKAKKYYYVQLRTYKTVKGDKYYSGWSKVKKIKTR